MILADFVNPSGLQAIGGNLFVETVASGNALIGAPGQQSMGKVLQGALENSNVDIVEEMVNMISTQRAYELNSKVVSTADQIDRKSTRLNSSHVAISYAVFCL